MASIYKNGDYFYLSVSLDGKRKSRSLGTKDKCVAKELKLTVVKAIILELIGIMPKCPKLSFPELAKRFLNENNHWSNTTYALNESILRLHIAGKPLPSNPTYRYVYVRHINQCWRWGLKHNLVDKAELLPGPENGEPSHRTYTHSELEKMFNLIQPVDFNKFVQLAYYTGARNGEIRSISRENILDGSIVVFGKTGRRFIKFNSQEQKLINSQDLLWNYKRDYVTHKFKKEVRRFGI